MDVCHGTWIPSPITPHEFDNNGQLVVWVETATRSKRKKQPHEHPFHLAQPDELREWFTSELTVYKDLLLPNVAPALRFYATLPSITEDKQASPLPSMEMAQLTGHYPPDDYHWQSWTIQGLSIAQPLYFLRELQFAMHFLPTGIRFGADLLFWIQYAQQLRNVIRQHQFIPILQCPQTNAPKKSKTPPTHFNFYTGWAPAEVGIYEQGLVDFANAMPLVCTTYDTQPPQSHPPASLQGWEPITLLRHFSEQQINLLAKNTPLTLKASKQLADTWLFDNFGSTLIQSGLSLEEWRQWHAWQQALLSNSAQGQDFILGLRLQTSDETSRDSTWWLNFFVESSQDPSLKIDLADWWALSSTEQKQWYKHFGQQFERKLLVSMGHAARMCPVLWQALESSKPDGLPLNLEGAYEFLKNDALLLEATGFKIVLPSWWTPQGRKRARLRIKASGKTKAAADQNSAKGYFSLPDLVQYRYELSIGDETVSKQEWQNLVNAKTPLVQFRGEWMELDREHMDELLQLMRQQEQGEITPISLQDMLKQRAEANEQMTEFVFDEALNDILTRLQQPRATDLLDNPQGLQGQLRPYQKQGLSWLATQEALGLNPCLADDMGLGKTIQVIALLLHEQAQRKPEQKLAPTLLIAPTSVLSNWQKELQKFAPSLSSLIHHGSKRSTVAADFKANVAAHQVIITSFTIARKDSELLKKQPWQRVIIDEAQNIKNPKSAQAKAIYSLNAPHRIAMTGTPIENRLMDMWSLFHFLNPGYLGAATQFKRAYETPIQREGDIQRSQQLQRLVQPFILRRLKTDKSIISDLPDKLEQNVYCNLTQEQATLYQATVDEVQRKLEEVEGMQRRGLILSTLLRLKQICNHPAQFLQDGSVFSAERSHKLARVQEMLEEALEAGDSMLLFTQFTEIGSQLEKTLREKYACPIYYLHGATSRKQREQMIEAFQDPDTPAGIFILSLKAGGVGITLTRANHVFHFDRWWNPAVENQATDRAYRIGQQKTVFAHKMVTLGTLEERIDQMITDKKALADSIVGTDETWLTEMDNAAFYQLIQLNRTTIMEA
ncbi:DEAD/DEAH box helicase [Thiofilum flexile]|uniref:DEAD/DEAH box helicase n=1 Tax=Thiofilum flexile TaxID=125627 RepID=UPI00035EFFC8|nr:DEAD/DEAH box helicase [Thiofilum flexile]